MSILWLILQNISPLNEEGYRQLDKKNNTSFKVDSKSEKRKDKYHNEKTKQRAQNLTRVEKFKSGAQEEVNICD